MLDALAPADPKRRDVLAVLLVGLAFVLLMGGFFGAYDPFVVDEGRELLGVGGFEDSERFAGTAHGWRGFNRATTWGPGYGIDGSAGVRLAPEEGVGRSRLLFEVAPEVVESLEFVRFRGFMRTEGITRGPRNWDRARFVVFFRDAEGEVDWSNPHTVCRFLGTKDWRACEATFRVPDTAHTGYVVVQHSGSSGRAFVDDLTLVPARPKASYALSRWAFALGFAAVLLFSIFRLRLPFRRLGLVVTALIAVIVVGVTAPAGTIGHALSVAAASAAEVRSFVEDFGAGGQATAPPDAPGTPAGDEQASRATAREEGAPAAEPSERAESGGSSGEEGAQVSEPAEDSRHPRRGVAEGEGFELGDGFLTLTKKSGHAILFALLAVAVALCFARGGTSLLALSAAAAPGLLIFAAATELLQLLVEKRQPTMFDWSLDALGIAVGLAAGSALIVTTRFTVSLWRRRSASSPG